MYKAGILLIHYQNSPHTKACLDSLVPAVSKTSAQVYVLNMCGKPAAELPQHPVKPIVLNEPQNTGFTGGNNRLMTQALADGCEAVVLLNNDTVVSKDFLTPLLKRLEDKQVGMVCPKIYFEKGYEFHRDAYRKQELGRVVWYAGGVLNWNHVQASHWGVDEVDHGQFETAETTDFATGCCVAIRADVIKQTGMFDDRYFLYSEDADWSMRVKRNGYMIMVEPAAIIWHKNAGSTSGSGSALHVYYQTRNRFLFGMRYAPWRVKYHLIKQYIGYLQRANTSEKKAAMDVFLGRYGYNPGPFA